VGQQQVVHRPEHRGELLLPAQRARLGQLELPEHPVCQRAEQLLLVAHVPVEGHGGHAAALGQGAHGQPGVALIGDQGGRGVDDVLAGQLAGPGPVAS